jgi:hypothetical protein
MQWHLHGLGDQGHQHEQKHAARETVRHGRIGPQRASGAVIDDQDAGQQTVSGNVGHQQHFARAVHRLAVGVPKADQAEGAEAYQFPAEIEEEEVGAVDEPDKAADEDQHRGVKAGRGPVVGHVSNGIKEYEAAQSGPH